MDRNHFYNDNYYLLLLLLEDKSGEQRKSYQNVSQSFAWHERKGTEQRKFEFKRVTANGETHKPWAQHYYAFRSTMDLYNGAQVCCNERIKGNQNQCNNRANSNGRCYKQLEEFSLVLESELNQLYHFSWFSSLLIFANA